MPRKRRSSVMQKRKYHYKKVRGEESPTNEDDVCLEPEDSSGLDSSQLDHSYGFSDPGEVSVVNSTHHDHSYGYSDPEEFCRTNSTHHDISDGCQDLEELPHSDSLPLGELRDGDSGLNIDSDSDGPESVVHDTSNDIPLGQRVEVETVEITDPYLKLQSDLLGKVTFPFILDCNGPSSLIEIIQLYRSENRTSVKHSLVIGRDFKVSLFVHRVLIPENHEFWTELSSSVKNVDDVCKILDKLMPYGVCVGNPDHEFQELTPVGCGLSSAATSQEITAYREGDFCAVQGNLSYSSTIRNVQCTMLVLGARCPHCSSTRRHLRARKTRLEEMTLRTLPLSSTYKHRDMTKDMLIKKVNQQTAKIKTLQQKLDKMRRDCDREIRKNGITMNPIQNEEIKDLMATCEKDMETAYPDCNSFQRLFWEQQKKAIKLGKNGMRWHPTIIRWCLYVRQKSAAAYDALRDSGFIKLPSSRTLFDYSHYLKSALGFQPDVIRLLHEECEKTKMLQHDEEWKSFVGILFDEIRIKEDLVYDKHSGELIGYCNLDDVGNQIMELEKSANQTTSQLAKCMLVLMVRGVATSLRFPLAGFATNSISADFLYPILWKTVSILEVTVGLKVLFFTCDGASANRKFFQMHKLPGHEGAVYFTPNPYDETRKLFFISDVPHLLKTARNCFSNSQSHKMTRHMWKNGKDISWMHIVRLFEEHCEENLYTPCPKLTRGHIDLTAFSCMKVNLAAQILSGTVANALEEFYGQEVTETVKFIRNLNKFFDCLNVRNLLEGRNKRNPDLNPYRDVDDPRITWLREDFLGYLQEWERDIENRQGNHTAAEKSGMQLSHQTKIGLEVTIKSVTECIKFMIEQGAEFVLTHHFNQDPLEQYFGHFRHKGGANQNPTVYEVRNSMSQLLVYRTQALAPKRGNITHENENIPAINNQKLPRRKSGK